MKQAIILAGGKGTRLRERLGDLPKPLIDICGVPLLERQILLLKKYNFEEIIILVNYQSEKILDFCKSKNNWELNVKCIDDGNPLGTAGATLKIFDILSDEFLVMYGDTMLDVDLNRFYEFHCSDTESMATLFLHPNDHPFDSDIIEINQSGDIIKFHNYPHTDGIYIPNLVNAALYWIKKEGIKKWKNNQNNIDFAKDLFPLMLSDNMCLKGYNSTEYIKDCGTPSRLDRVCLDFKSGKIEKSSLNYKHKAVFLDRDGTINKEVDHLNNHSQFELLPNTEIAIKKLNKSEFLTCVVTNQPVVARGELTVSELNMIHNKMETVLGQSGAYVDRIFYCPHHPDSGYEGEVIELKMKCTCRKPMPGMIVKASRELNIDLNNSWLIGDSTTDIETAKRIGINSILVETGYAGLDQKYWAVPDFIVPEINAGVDFILDTYPKYINFCSKYAGEIEHSGFVFIGGLSRSGKTTFASVLKNSLKLTGKNAHVLSLDRWLKSKENRTEGVIGRYDIDEFNNFIQSVWNNRENDQILSLPGYQKLKNKRIDSIETIDYKNGDILIIEGTIALNLDVLKFFPSVNFYVNLDETIRKERVLKEYLLRGYSHENAKEIYFQRQIDETPIVISSSSKGILIDSTQFY